MSAAAAPFRWLQAPAAFLWRLVRGSKPIEKRWSPTWFINVVSAMVIVAVLLAEIVTSSIRIGVAPVLKCLEGDGFLILRHAPEHIERNHLYAISGAGYGERYGLNFGPSDTLVKYVAALPGDRIRVDEGGIWINDEWWGGINPQSMEKLGLSMEDIRRTYVLEDGQMLLLGTLARSIDGRYLGPTPMANLIGPAWRLW